MRGDGMKLVAGLLLAASAARADSYQTLLRRYERQIVQQEKHLKSLRANLVTKEKEAQRWQQKAQEAKSQWASAQDDVKEAKTALRRVQGKWNEAHVLAEQATWKATEGLLVSRAARDQLAFLAIETYQRAKTPHLFEPILLAEALPQTLLASMHGLTAAAESQVASALDEEESLREQASRLRAQEETQAAKLERLRGRQQDMWAKWQEALERRSALEEEKDQLEQSAQALRVMLKELRQHRDQTKASVRADRPFTDPALAALRGTLPWPTAGKVTQSFGRQYSSELQQLLVSNGIRIAAPEGKPVRAIESGKVLFAAPFGRYGQLVIVQHPRRMTSVYGGLGQVQAREGQQVAALEAIGVIGPSNNFYFELRRDEEPVDPLVYLSPSKGQDLSSRRKFP